MKIEQAVILAGGRGIRLSPLTNDLPKPMVNINGKPFLEYVINDLKKNNIKEVVLLVGYLHEKIEDYFGNGQKFGVSITYSYSSTETDTGLRLKNAANLLNKKFLLLYADNIWPLNLKELLKIYNQIKKTALMTVFNNRLGKIENNVYVEDNLVLKYDKSRKDKKLNGLNIGYFILHKSTIENSPKSNFSFDDIILNLIKRKELGAFTTDIQYYSLTSPDRLPNIKKYLTNRKVVFLDRDGVINKKAPKAKYITNWKDFIFLPKSIDALGQLMKKGYEIYIVTNQPGIARNILTKQKLDEIHKNMLKELKKFGIEIKKIYICPHGWDENCWCRKPNPGMLYEASTDFQINLEKSFFIGDDIRDKKAGDLAGVKTFLVRQNVSFFDIVSKYL